MKIKYFLFLSALTLNTAFSDDVKLVGTVSQSIRLSQNSSRFLADALPAKKVISFLAIRLMPDAHRNLLLRLQKPTFLQTSSTGGQAKQLGMNGVPVLDQGAHGTCVTFAVTAALNAASTKKDGISQLCSLMLGNYLAKNAYQPSGWDGSFGHVVLNQLENFGTVSKEQERAVGCGGLYEYPAITFDTPSEQMSLEDYHQLTANTPLVQSYPILHVAQAFLLSTDTQKTLNDVKRAINAGDRVVFGSLLVDTDLGVVGAIGKYHQMNDTWVLSETIKKDLEASTSDFAGHEMVITGYDDAAVAWDNDGKLHKGLLTLRNSWGPSVGDEGNFYMSYDYFKTLVIEAHRVLSEQATLE